MSLSAVIYRKGLTGEGGESGNHGLLQNCLTDLKHAPASYCRAFALLQVNKQQKRLFGSFIHHTEHAYTKWLSLLWDRELLRQTARSPSSAKALCSSGVLFHQNQKLWLPFIQELAAPLYSRKARKMGKPS